jgi:anti-sigma regulatory factor (Ser/Thr protein kinase)
MTVPGVTHPRRSALHTVGDQLQVSTIRLHATTMGRAHGLDGDTLDGLGVVVTELATNIARHAGRGHIILRPVGEHTTGCIEILALDKGPGIANMTRAMRDSGSPSAGEPGGGGFARIKRRAGLFDIYSYPGCGTAVVAHVGAQSGHAASRRCGESVLHGSVGVVCVPLHGEEECGDAWAVDMAPGRLTALLVDGLGHGPEAALAAFAATSAFHDAPTDAPEIILTSMHKALRDTRGAALSVMVVDQSRRTARFCGVGNVDGRVVTPDMSRQLVSQSGIVGHTMPRVQPVDIPWPGGGRLVMHSDGISSRWRTDHYPGLLARHAALLAGVIFRDFSRQRDDATVLVVRDTVPATAA